MLLCINEITLIKVQIRITNTGKAMYNQYSSAKETLIKSQNQHLL